MATKEEAAIVAKLKQKGLPTKDNDDEEANTEVVVEDSDESEELLSDTGAAEGEGEVEVVEEESEEVEIDESTTEISADEQLARDSGWKPQDEWDGAPEDWVSARQFNRNGEYLRKIHNQNRKIKQLDEVVGTLAQQQKKIFEAGYDKAKRELKMQLREANKEGDDASAEALEERMEQLEKQRTEDLAAVNIKVEQEQPPIAPEFTTWVQNNKWFISNVPLRKYAETIGTEFAQKNPQRTNVEVYQYVTAEVKKRFPEEFGTVQKSPKKKIGSPVVGGNDLSSGNRGNSAASVRVSLTPEEKAVGRALMDKGMYKTMNEYATDLHKFGVKNK